jgi:hypothetical protein
MIFPEDCDNAKSINQFVRDHYGELVIDQSHKVSRLVDSYSGEDDYYWVLEGFWGKKHMETCVGGLTLLKGWLLDKDYEEQDRSFELNGSPKRVKPHA